MTKSKKMKKSTFAIVIMSILMVAMLAFGGTYAYFTASATGSSKAVKMGQVIITTDGAITSTFNTADKLAVTGDTLFTGNVGYVNGSNVDSIVYATFTFTYTGKIWSKAATAGDAGIAATILAADTAGTEVATGLGATKGYFYEVSNMPITAGSELSGWTIDTNTWKQVGETNVYFYNPTDSNYKVAPAADDDDPVNFFTTLAVTLDADRHFAEGVYQGTAATGNELVWEDATLAMNVTFDSIQYRNITGDGVSYTEAGVLQVTDAAKLLAAIQAE